MSYANIFEEIMDNLSTYPFSLDIIEEKDHYIVLAEVPGIKSENIEVSVNHEYVEISILNPEEDEGELNYIHRERPNKYAKRRLSLSKPIESTKASIELNNGVLIIKIPYAEEAKRVTLKIE